MPINPELSEFIPNSTLTIPVSGLITLAVLQLKTLVSYSFPLHAVPVAVLAYIGDHFYEEVNIIGVNVKLVIIA